MQWAIVRNYAEIRLYSRQKSSNHVHRVFLTELDETRTSSPSSTRSSTPTACWERAVSPRNTGWLLRETGERQEKVSVELYRGYADRRVELDPGASGQGRDRPGPGDPGRPCQRLLDRVPFHRLRRGSGLASRPKPAQSHGLRAGCRPHGVAGLSAPLPLDRQGRPA